MVRVKDILPEKVKHKRREMRRARLMWMLLIALVLLGAAIGLSHWSAVTIASVKVEGNTVTPTFEIEQIANEALDDRYLFIFPKRMVVLSPKNAIEQRILGKWPRIKSVSVRADSFTSLHIQIHERAAEYTWCGDKVEFAIEIQRMRGGIAGSRNVPEQQCYYLDAAGFAFSEAPQISGNVYFKLYGGELVDANPLLRRTFAPPARFEAMNNFLAALRGAKLTPTHLVLHYNGDAEALLAPTTKQPQGARIIFTVDQNLDKALEAIGIAFGQNASTTIDYIDVRYANKVYLKKR